MRKYLSDLLAWETCLNERKQLVLSELPHISNIQLISS